MSGWSAVGPRDVGKFSHYWKSLVKKYEHSLIMGDFNVNVSELTLTLFYTLFKLKNRIQKILA